MASSVVSLVGKDSRPPVTLEIEHGDEKVTLEVPAHIIERVPTWHDAPSSTEAIPVFDLTPAQVSLALAFATEDAANPIVLRHLTQPDYLNEVDVHVKYDELVKKATDDKVKEALEVERQTTIEALDRMPKMTNTTDLTAFGYPSWTKEFIADMGPAELGAMATLGDALGYTAMVFLAGAGLARIYAVMTDEQIAYLNKMVEDYVATLDVTTEEFYDKLRKENEWATR